jgi:hypothetical protein
VIQVPVHVERSIRIAVNCKQIHRITDRKINCHFSINIIIIIITAENIVIRHFLTNLVTLNYKVCGFQCDL